MKKYTKTIFSEIKNAKSIDKLIELEKSFDKFRMDENTYPKINFRINKNEIEQLIKSGILDENFQFQNDLNSRLNDPLIKLFYALAWKNGDLKKLKHIIKGIYENESENEQSEALVFYQFGKYLSQDEQPIIDQHVIRAYKCYTSNSDEEFEKNRTLGQLDKKNQTDISEYKKWLRDSNDYLKTNQDYFYFVDRILFALGRKLKINTSRKT